MGSSSRWHPEGSVPAPRWWAGIVLFVVVVLAQFFAALGMFAVRAAFDLDFDAEVWWRLVYILGDVGVVIALGVALRAGRLPVRPTLNLRRAPAWTFLVVPIMFMAERPWHFLFLPEAEPAGSDPASSGMVQLMLLVQVAVLTPVIEEAVFRGYIFSGFRRHSAVLAIFGSAVLFILLHLDYREPLWALLHLPGGLLFAYAVERTKSLYPGLLAHALWNALVWFDAPEFLGTSPMGLALSVIVLVSSLMLLTLGTGPGTARSHSPP